MIHQHFVLNPLAMEGTGDGSGGEVVVVEVPAISPGHLAILGLSIAAFVVALVWSCSSRSGGGHPPAPHRRSSKVSSRDYPAHVVISGAVGKTARDGNGTFIRTTEDSNGAPLYIKSKADPIGDTTHDAILHQEMDQQEPAMRWLRYMKGSTPTWVISSDESKRENGTTCLWYSLDAATLDP